MHAMLKNTTRPRPNADTKQLTLHGCKSTIKVRYYTTHTTSNHPGKPNAREEGPEQEGKGGPEDLYLHRVLVASVLAAVN